MRPSVTTICYGFLTSALVAASLSVGAGDALARPAEPQPKDMQIANMVTQYMQFKHLSGRALDDEISQRCLKTFLKSLDSMKVFFRQSDVDEFMQMETRIDDFFRENDFREALEFAKTMFDRFLLRVDERKRCFARNTILRSTRKWCATPMRPRTPGRSWRPTIVGVGA